MTVVETVGNIQFKLCLKNKALARGLFFGLNSGMRIQTLISLVKPYYSSGDPAHDWAHVERVASNARLIAKSENVNQELVLAAVYCHDLVNLDKDHPRRKEASSLSANKAVPLLNKAQFNQEEIEVISAGIIEHSFSNGLRPSNQIAAIVQDADRLDALGAIGILRCAAVSTQLRSTFYEVTDPLANHRELNDKQFMLDHYFVKLFKLPDLMNTAKAREIANDRINLMQLFIENLIKEVKQPNS